MGKTWKRRDAGGRRTRQDRDADFPRKGEGSDLSPEESYAMLEHLFSCWFDSQLEMGLFGESDREDLWQSLSMEVAKSLSNYDPVRKGRDGRCASRTTYLWSVFGKCSAMYVRSAMRRKAAFPQQLEIVSQPATVANRTGNSISAEDLRLSDRCRTVRQLEFRMDVMTLRRLLTLEERRVLDMRMAGETEEDVLQSVGCTKSHLYKVYLRSIQRKARAIGFFSREDVRKGLDTAYFRKISERSRELFRRCGK